MTLKYKGYEAGPIQLDPDDGTFSGVVATLKDIIHFEGLTADELRHSFQVSVNDYLALCAERGEEPEAA